VWLRGSRFPVEPWLPILSADALAFRIDLLKQMMKPVELNWDLRDRKDGTQLAPNEACHVLCAAVPHRLGPFDAMPRKLGRSRPAIPIATISGAAYHADLPSRATKLRRRTPSARKPSTHRRGTRHFGKNVATAISFRECACLFG
jgi:hypothetical protein